MKKSISFLLITFAVVAQEQSLTKILFMVTPRIDYKQASIDSLLKTIGEVRSRSAQKYKKYLNATSVALEMIKKSEDQKALDEINRIVIKRKQLKKEIERLDEELSKTPRKGYEGHLEELRDTINSLFNEQEEIDAYMEKAVKKYSPKYYAIGLFPELKDIIEVISNLLSLKSFLFSNYHPFLYRFIHLYPVFVLIDDVEPRPKIYSMLREMQGIGRDLRRNIVIEDALVESFKEFLKVVDAAALDVGLKLFAKDMQVLTALL